MLIYANFPTSYIIFYALHVVYCILVVLKKYLSLIISKIKSYFNFY